jgi:hypothetical protein
MSVLSRGQRCIVVEGCPKNIGLLVEVVEHLGQYKEYLDCYEIVTISGRPFPQLWADDEHTRTVSGFSRYALTERYKIKPLQDLPECTDEQITELPFEGDSLPTLVR